MSASVNGWTLDIPDTKRAGNVVHCVVMVYGPTGELTPDPYTMPAEQLLPMVGLSPQLAKGLRAVEMKPSRWGNFAEGVFWCSRPYDPVGIGEMRCFG